MALNFQTPINLNKLELQNARIQNLGSAPGSPVEGQLYYDTSDDNLYCYANGGWVDLTVQGGGLSYGTPSATINAGDAAVAGVSTDVLRADAQFAVSTAAAIAIDGINAEGNSTSLARANHTHAYGTASIPVAAFAAGVRLDTINVPTAAVSLNSQKITNLLDGTNAGDAVNLSQLQAAQAGLDAKQSVRAATTSALTFTIAAGEVTVIAGTTVDGVTIAVGERILVKDAPASTGGGSANSSQPGNGIYIVTNNTTNLTVDRTTDMDAWTEVPGAFVNVEEGTANVDSTWLCTANIGGTLNTTAIAWTQWEVAAIAAGAGLTKTGTTIDVVGTSNRITVNANDIDIAATYVGQTSITTLGTITSGTWNGTDIGTADGGTGSSTIAGARTNLKAAGYYTATGSGTAATFVINQATHLVGGADRFKVCFVTLVADGSQVIVDQTIDASGNVTFTFATSQTLSDYRFHIIAA